MGKFAALGVISVMGVSALVWRPWTPVAAPADAMGARSVPSADGATGAAMLPARLLRCRLGRITNFTPSREQDPSEFVYDGEHAFALFLPSIAVRTKEPPRSTLPPEPVDPRTRIVADPDGISAGAAVKPFERVVDYWPDRVEMTTALEGGVVNLIILQKSQRKPGVVDMFMTRATDAVTWDQQHLYSGQCRIESQNLG